jgi:hypothetical protein
MRFFRKETTVQEAPCPRCCVTIAMDARECPVCGLNLQEPESTQDGWAPPVEHAEEAPPPVDQRTTAFR